MNGNKGLTNPFSPTLPLYSLFGSDISVFSFNLEPIKTPKAIDNEINTTETKIVLTFFILFKSNFQSKRIYNFLSYQNAKLLGK